MNLDETNTCSVDPHVITFEHNSGHALTFPAAMNPAEVAERIAAFVDQLDGGHSGTATQLIEYWRDKAKALRKERDALRVERDALSDELANRREASRRQRRELRTDGDLLADLIANRCPEWLTDDAAREIAEATVADLARVPRMVVLRGTHSEPWHPDDEPGTRRAA